MGIIKKLQSGKIFSGNAIDENNDRMQVRICVHCDTNPLSLVEGIKIIFDVWLKSSVPNPQHIRHSLILPITYDADTALFWDGYYFNDMLTTIQQNTDSDWHPLINQAFELMLIDSLE